MKRASIFTIFILLFGSICVAQIDSSKYESAYQTDITVCPSCVKYLTVSDTSGFREDVRKAINITHLTLKNSSITHLPDYLSQFPNLTHLDLEDVKTVPTNIGILCSLESVTLINCNKLDFTNFFASCKPLKTVRIFLPESLVIPTIPAQYIILKDLNLSWNKAKTIDVSACKGLYLVTSNFNVLNTFINVASIKEMEIEACCYVEVGESFYKKFEGLNDVKIYRPSYHKDNRCIAGSIGHPSNW